METINIYLLLQLDYKVQYLLVPSVICSVHAWYIGLHYNGYHSNQVEGQYYQVMVLVHKLWIKCLYLYLWMVDIKLSASINTSYKGKFEIWKVTHNMEHCLPFHITRKNFVQIRIIPYVWNILSLVIKRRENRTRGFNEPLSLTWFMKKTAWQIL